MACCRRLYAIPVLQPIFRMVNLAYARPSKLLLQGCVGQAIMSSQGVRQGDPLSALLFCVHMRDVLQQVHDETGVEVYGFSDDINLVGKPQQLMKALKHMQTRLPGLSLQLNTSKSHFTYFHDERTPLSKQVRTELSNCNISYHHDWVGVVGAVVGRDDEAIRRGIRTILADVGNHQTFFDRIRLPEIRTDTAMLLLRQCMVPSINYLLRCMAPTCIDEEARQFDERMLEAAMDRFGLEGQDSSSDVTSLMQSKLTHGGWGLTSAVANSPAAFLGSLAASTG